LVAVLGMDNTMFMIDYDIVLNYINIDGLIVER